MSDRQNDLEKRIAELEHRVKQLLTLSDRSKHPFTCHMIETNITKEQEEGILTLMKDAQRSLSTSNPMTHNEFERQVYSIVPQQEGNYHFAEAIVRTLNDSSQFTDVYAHMERDGMNL